MTPEWHKRISLDTTLAASQIKRGCRYTHLEKRLPELKDRNLLLISGLRDNYVTPEITEELSANIGGTNHSLWFVEGAKHNMSRQVDPAEYDSRLIEFFTDGLNVPVETGRPHNFKDSATMRSPPPPRNIRGQASPLKIL